MIQFPQNFFEGEERDGFYVEPMMKSAWAAQLEVLKQIELICDRHNIKYFAYWGTLLGAVRHGGYIPWDDDLDISMLREDYVKFLEVAAKELPDGYKLMSPYTSDGWDESIARVTNSQSISFSKDFIQRHHGCPFCIGVDIFPYDYLPSDPDTQNYLDSILSLISELQAHAPNDSTSPQALLDSMNQLSTMLDYTFAKDMSPVTQLGILYDELSAAYGSKSDKYLTCYPERIKRKGEYKLPAYWLEDSISLPFECTTIKVPKYYELCLSICYGKNFMTPVKGIAGHDYPFYNKQIETVKENGRWEELSAIISELQNHNASSMPTDHTRDSADILSQNYDYFSALKSTTSQKILLYYVSAMDFYDQEEKTFDKIIDTLNYFEHCTDKIKLIFVACDDVTDLLMHLNPELAYEYDDMRAYYSDQDWLIYDNGDHLYDAISVCDAFYGNQNIATGLIQKLKKPIMIQNVDILNTPSGGGN